VALQGSRVRSCTVVVVPRPRRIAVRTGTAAAGTDCRLALEPGHPVADKDRLVGKGPMVGKGTGMDTDIRDPPRRLWARSPVRPNSCLVCPYACPSASLRWYKVLKIMENNEV